MLRQSVCCSELVTEGTSDASASTTSGSEPQRRGRYHARNSNCSRRNCDQSDSSASSACPCRLWYTATSYPKQQQANTPGRRLYHHQRRQPHRSHTRCAHTQYARYNFFYLLLQIVSLLTCCIIGSLTVLQCTVLQKNLTISNQPTTYYKWWGDLP